LLVIPERRETVGGQAQSDITVVFKKFVGEFRGVDFNILITKQAIVGTIKYVAEFAWNVLVTASSVLHKISHAGVCHEAYQARCDGDVRILPPWLAIRKISILFAVRTFGKIGMRADVAATGIWATVILLRSES